MIFHQKGAKDLCYMCISLPKGKCTTQRQCTKHDVIIQSRKLADFFKNSFKDGDRKVLQVFNEMGDSDVIDENLTSALLEEVFNEVDSQEETPSKLNTSSGKTEFLADEYNADLGAALGLTKDSGVKKKTSAKFSNPDGAEKEISLIEEGDNCNSDDDDPFKEGEGVKWISSNTVLKSNPGKASNFFSDGTPKNVKKWTEMKSVKDKLNETLSKVQSSLGDSKDLLVDPVLCMRIVNPKVSMTALRDRMTGREAVPPFKIKRFLETKDVTEIDWVTGGAIVGKFVTKSQKGNPYCIWTLSDLRGDIKLISVFLFGSAYKEYWKLPLGTVVGILNASLFENKNNKTEATLRVDISDKIMIFGTSKDYGTCRSKKANGENCTAVVNKSSCEYCIYHVKQVYDKASRRPELQASFTGSGLMNLRNKVLGKNEVFYGGQSFTAIRGKPATAQSPREHDRLRLMAEASKDRTKFLRDQELLKRLNGEGKTQTKTPTAGNSSPAQQNVNTENSKPKTQKFIDLDLPITNKQILRARANAIRFIRQNGPLKRPNDDIRKKKKTPEEILSLKRKLESEECESKKMKMSESEATDPLKQKKEKHGITDRFMELMNAKPTNPELLKEGESEEREKYFQKLEIKEKMEEKMASTYKIDCKAVRCLKCNYKSFSASELCKKEKHPLKVVNAVKRFWKCGDCSARTVSLELVPLHSCKVCGGSKWEKTSMLSEKKAKPLPSETLSIRGHEETFVGSVVRNPNINLLVPDEGS